MLVGCCLISDFVVVGWLLVVGLLTICSMLFVVVRCSFCVVRFSLCVVHSSLLFVVLCSVFSVRRWLWVVGRCWLVASCLVA